MRSWPFAAAALLIGGTLAFTEVRSSLPELAPEKPLLDLPRALGAWTVARDLPLTEKELDLLKLSDYVSRVYVDADTKEAPVVLYLGYYRSQKTGATYHSPLNCLPGSGWQIAETSYVNVPGRASQVKRLVIERETQRDVVLYWYHDRGRVVTSEYAAKAYLIWDGLKWNRTDGSLVRVSTRVTTTVEAATERALRFVAELWPALEARLPSPARS